MRKNISLTQITEQRAWEIIKARGFAGLSDLIAALVREEYERRVPPQINSPGAQAPGALAARVLQHAMDTAREQSSAGGRPPAEQSSGSAPQEKDA